MLFDNIKKEKIHPAFDPFSDQNKIYFDIVENIAEYGNSNNLDYCFTGGLALVLMHRKMFRAISDIDININKEQIETWRKFLKDNYNCDLIYKDDVGTWKGYQGELTVQDKKFKIDLFIAISPERIRSISPRLLKKLQIENKIFYISDIFLGFKEKLKREKDLLDISYYNINYIDPFDRPDLDIKSTNKIKVFRVKT